MGVKQPGPSLQPDSSGLYTKGKMGKDPQGVPSLGTVLVVEEIDI